MLLRHPLRILAFVVGSLVLGVVPGRAAQSGASSSPELRVMSFNIRYGTAPDGENAWEKRADFVFDVIAAFNPDLIGFQEVVAKQYDAILERMPEYSFCGVARTDGKRAGEWSLVGFRKSKFSAIKNGDFWLSEEPTVIGSKSWDAALTRICSWARLRETASGREFLFANTHFDHKGVVARLESSRLLSKQLAAIGEGAPAILTGDFNITEDTPAYATLVRPAAPDAPRWIDAFRTVHPKRGPDEASGHAFKGRVTGSRIDYVFHSAHFVATASEIVRTAREGRWPSDHYPVTALLRWK